MGIVPVHTPAWQESVRVQALPSLQAVPSGFAGLEQAPVAGSQVPVGRAWCRAREEMSVVAVYITTKQEAVRVQALPSLQAVPSGFARWEQAPAAGWRLPASWRGCAAAQLTGFVPVHTPAWQESVRVQALPSLQAAPSGFAGLEQAPVAGSQVPASWHWSAGAQGRGIVPVHAPARQVTDSVQALPSLQAAPSGFAGWEQAPVAGLQVPASWD